MRQSRFIEFLLWATTPLRMVAYAAARAIDRATGPRR